MTDRQQHSLGAVQRFHNAMLDEDIILAYEGEINKNITNAFTSMAERGFIKANQSEYVKHKRLYHIMVECLQNICKHSKDVIVDEQKERLGSGIVIVVKNELGYEMLTGNRIEVDDANKLTSLLSSLNKMTVEEIREHYKNNLRENQLSDRGGAGLGFIDIIKKTGNAIEYSFETIDANNVFFVSKIVIN